MQWKKIYSHYSKENFDNDQTSKNVVLMQIDANKVVNWWFKIVNRSIKQIAMYHDGTKYILS